MEYRRFDNTIVARIDKGEEILDQVKEIALKEEIKLASIQALGLSASLQQVFLRRRKRNTWSMNLRAALRSCH